LFVRLKVALVAPATDAVTEYEPGAVLAVNVLEVA
jgi:hypothetical protein